MQRLKVNAIEEGAKAAKAGVMVGDYLDAYDDESLGTIQELLRTIEEGQFISEHTLRLIRGEQFLELACESGRLGVSLEEVSLDSDKYHHSLTNFLNTKKSELEAAISAIVLSTTPFLDGYKTEVIEIITAECAFGMNFFRDLFAQMTDIFGGRSGTTQKALRDARKVCLRELKAEALRAGADAVIGVDMDYSEFSGQGKSMLFLVATGTAVKLIPNQ